MRIGLLGAMAEEVDEILSCMEKKETLEVGGVHFYQGILEEQDVVLAHSGIGKVNAAMTVQKMVDYFHIDLLIFTGIAGAVDPALKVGDIVISDDSVQHDFDVSIFGYDKGRIPRLKKKLFYADRGLMERFLRASQTIRKESPEVNVFLGRVLSGDQFVASAAKNRELYSQFFGLCVEMEGAAAAQVCYVNRIPHVIIRSISDRADQRAEVDYRAFSAQAAKRSCLLVKEVIRDWDRPAEQ
jgi:adenosylhomocysteine nucleosidase